MKLQTIFVTVLAIIVFQSCQKEPGPDIISGSGYGIPFVFIPLTSIPLTNSGIVRGMEVRGMGKTWGPVFRLSDSDQRALRFPFAYLQEIGWGERFDQAPHLIVTKSLWFNSA